MTLQEFINRWNGKSLEAEDPTNRWQCFDLAFGWVDNLGIPRSAIRHLYAYEIFTRPNAQTGQYFDRIANTPAGVPKPGDLVVWGTSVGVAGHVAIFQSGNANGFTSFDQNWGGKQYCVLTNHNYNGVIGWLHPKTQQAPPPQGGKEVPVTNPDRDNLYQDLLGRSPIGDSGAGGWVGAEWPSAYYGIRNSQEAQDHRARVASAEARATDWQKRAEGEAAAAAGIREELEACKAKPAPTPEQVPDSLGQAIRAAIDQISAYLKQKRN